MYEAGKKVEGNAGGGRKMKKVDEKLSDVPDIIMCATGVLVSLRPLKEAIKILDKEIEKLKEVVENEVGRFSRGVEGGCEEVL